MRWYNVCWVESMDCIQSGPAQAAKEALDVLSRTDHAPKDRTFFVIDRDGKETTIDLNEETTQ